MSPAGPTYQWLILQDGNLPLSPDQQASSSEHVCTVTLIWPEAEWPTATNSLIVDPCFSPRGWQSALDRLASINASPADVGYFVESHQHGNHTFEIPELRSPVKLRRPIRINWRRLDPMAIELPGIELVPCPGHDPHLRAVRFRDRAGENWIASDAVLNQDWLVAWEYYWPNFYTKAEIIQTWRSVARIVGAADTIIPGHGPAIEVDVELLEELIERFPGAEHAGQCLDVLFALTRRLAKLR